MPFITPAQFPEPSETVAENAPNWAVAFGYRPELLDAWTVMLGCIKVRMQPRRFELATLAASLALKSSYSALAHGSLLRAMVGDEAFVELLHQGPTDEVDRAIMDFARMIVNDASAIRASDLDRLRRAGLDEAEICDVAAAAAARSFFAKYIDALGVEPDAHYLKIPGVMRDALTPGRSISA